MILPEVRVQSNIVLGRSLTILLLVGLSGVSSAGGLRVSKAKKLTQLRLYWAQAISDREVQVYPFPHGAAVGDEFEMADAGGYLGRVKVTHIEQQQAGCNNLVYHIASASYIDTPSRQASGTLMAFSPGRQLALRSRVMNQDEVKTQPADMTKRRLQPEVALDLDGDRLPDVLRYYYECSSKQGVYRDCIDTYTARRGSWELQDRYTLEDCY